jgi:hypothetical protein
MGSASYAGEARKMGGLRVSVREPAENKRLRRKILDSRVLCGNRGGEIALTS